MTATRAPHVPVRQCVGCRERKAQAELTRFVRTPAGWRPDAAKVKRQPGRGAYLCSRACAARVEKNRKYPGLASAAAEYGFEHG